MCLHFAVYGGMIRNLQVRVLSATWNRRYSIRFSRNRQLEEEKGKEDGWTEHEVKGGELVMRNWKQSLCHSWI